MSATLSTNKISDRDRLAFTLFLSILFNAIIILGIGFEMADSLDDGITPTLDIILVEKKDSSTPDEADYLAQHEQSGAGNTEEKTRPTTASGAAALPIPTEGDAPVLQPKQAPQKQLSEQPDILTSYQAADKIFKQEQQDEESSQQPTSAQLIASAQEIARLEAEISQSMEVYSKRQKHRRITANTKSFRDAAYFDAWQRKIERIGNLNYPEEAKHRNLSGNLILEVAINADGTINDILILRTSGQKLLDDAAIRIVRLASPFAPLPQEMRKDTDVLHITRTWRFMSGNRFSGSN